VLIDLQTGLRKQELLSLRRQNVDFGRDVISRYEIRAENELNQAALHACYRRRHSPCDAFTNTNSSGNGKVVQLQNWTDTKVPTLNGNGQHALPVSA
jgi:integrase